MKKFSEMGIKPNCSAMLGEKIKINKVLNRTITILSFKIEESKYQKNKSGKCLYLQIECDSEKRIIFTGSDVLISMIQQVEKQDFSFETIIVKENEHFEFT